MKEKIFRMIDANVNRATEGLRVAEDIVRFVLDDSMLTGRLKDIRHQIVAIVKRISGPKPVSLFARNVHSDVGAKRTIKSESKRASIFNVFIANIKRAEESVRVFEELSKLFDPKLGSRFKKLRFELYDIEQKAAIKLKKKIKLDSPLYIITDNSFGHSHIEIMKEASKAGARMFQLRDKKMTKPELLRTAKAMSKLSKKLGITFIVNDHVDIAKRSGANGVHLGLRDAARVTRNSLHGMILGISASNLNEALRAQKLGADYIGFGPVFKTPIKPLAKPSGIKELRKVTKRVMIPVVAIGGVDKHNIRQVLSAGCNKVAVIRAICASKNVKKQTKEFLRLVSG